MTVTSREELHSFVLTLVGLNLPAATLAVEGIPRIPCQVVGRQ